MNKTLLSITSLLLLISSCVRNPVTGNKEITVVSKTQEIQIGKQAYQTAAQAEGGPYMLDPALSKYVSDVGHRLAKVSGRPDLPYEFIIINDSVPNAWALPGGKIAINRGLLTELNSEAELAAVLGHEIVHAAARHGAKGIERGILLQGGIIALGVAARNSAYNDVLITSAGVAAQLINTKYSRGQELESDHYGMLYMAKAGYDPEAAVSLQETFLRLSKGKSTWLDGLFASHPPSEERIKANKLTLQEVQEPGATFLGRDEYKAATRQLLANKEAYDNLQDAHKALAKKAYSQAYKSAKKAIELAPDEAHFWGAKGHALLLQKEPKEAIEAFNEAISRNDNYFEFYLLRAQARKMVGQNDGARRDAEKSVALLPTGEGHELLGKLCLKQGDTRRAVYHYQIAAHAQSPAGARAQAFLKLNARDQRIEW